MAKRTTTKQAALLPQLREMYVVLGISLTEAADTLGISRTTATAWRVADEAATRQLWDDLRRERMGRNPFDNLRQLEARLDSLIKVQADHLLDKGFDQQLEATMRCIDWLKDKLCDTARVLEMLQIFAGWCTRVYGGDLLKFDVLAEAVARCIDDLREGRFGAQQ